MRVKTHKQSGKRMGVFMDYKNNYKDKNRVSRRFGLLVLFLCVMIILTQGTIFANHVNIITIEGPITPVTAKYISDILEKSERDGAMALIIEMDTPGGLLESTWSIDKQLLSADVPVIVYISPSGGRAASAGVFISYAAHKVAMAPSTNIGSAHPVTMSGKDTSKVMMEKITNDAVAHIKGLAEKRGRNAVWAEDAVRKSVSITEKEALELGVIDFVAENLGDLLEQLEAKTIELPDRNAILHTRLTETRRIPMNWRYKILDKISHPNIAYLLMLAGIMGIFFELQNPGAIFPGVLGGISLILAFFALQVLPLNASGILLILLAVLFFILEINITSYGLLTIGGIVSMLLGSLMLFRTPEIKVSLSIIIPAVLGTAAFFIFAIGLGLRAQMKKAATGKKGIIGEIGEVVNTLNPEGQVSVHGEVWKAVSTEEIKKGEKVEVVEIKDLELRVRRVNP
jgi:membrane-bound serine protease (ClpP class)